MKARHFSSDAEVIAAAETWLDGQTSEYFFFEWLAKKSLVAVAFSFLVGLRTYQHLGISPLICKNWTSNKTSILQEKQKNVAEFYVLQKIREVVYPPHVLVILEDGLVTFLRFIRGQTVELFATHNSFQLKVAVSPFLKIRDDINFSSYLAEDTIRVH